jgi:hypothetical protein
MKVIAILGLVLALSVACGGGDNIFDIKEGDCFNYELSEVMTNVEFIQCDDPHQREVYATVSIDVAAGMAYPGDSRVDEAAANLCLEPFKEFVGTSYFDSVLEIEAFSPTRDSWEDIDDREVTCLLYDIEDLYMEGTMRGSGR